MPVGFSSPARNLFLLGSSGAQVVTNFFKTINQSAGTDGVYLPDEIKYNFVDQKFVLAGSAEDSNSKGFGWFEKRNETGVADWDVRIEAGAGINTTLRAMELDSNDNLIVVGKSGNAPWIAKYSNGGVIDWQATTFSGDVEYTGVTSDSNGIYYACGNTPTSGSAQAFVEKYTSTGTPDWGKSAFMLGRDVVLNSIAANTRGEVVAVGYLEDDVYNKGYIVKIDTNTGDVLWDRTLTPDWQGDMLNCTDVYIDSNDQIYVTVNGNFVGYLLKYTAEGNMIWQKVSNDSAASTITFDQVKSDGETEQTIVFGTYTDPNTNDIGGLLSKYSKDGKLVWRRTLFSSFNNSDTFANVSLDADPSFYYLLYTDGPYSALNGTPEAYTYGKVSSSGNGLGAFQYTEGTGETIDYEILSIGDTIGRLSDGSVRQDTSDLITYPFTANKLVFDDLATQVTNKKRQMDSAGSFEYSGSPAIRPADFQELNLLGDTGITEETIITPSTDENENFASVTSSYSSYGTVAENTVTNDLPFTATHYEGKVRDLQSGGFRVDLTGNTTGSEFIMGCWVKFDTYTTSRQMGIDLFGGYVYWETLANGAIGIRHNGGNRSDSNSTSLNDGNWHHIALVRSLGTLRGYVDGQQVVSTTSGVGGLSVNTNEQFWFFGGNGTSYNIDAKILDPFVYVGYSFSGSYTVPTAPLIDANGNINHLDSNLSGFEEYISPGISIAGESTPGSWVDQSGKGNSGTVNGATHNAAGYWEFDAAGEKITLSNVYALGTEDFTFEFWFRADSAGTGTWQYFFANRDSFNGPFTRIGIHNTTNQLRFYTEQTDQSNVQGLGATDVLDDTWHHAMFVRSGTGCDIYLDGALDNSVACMGGDIGNAVNDWIIGAQDSVGNGRFNGDLGEFRFYPRALTAAQVFQNYNATKETYTGVPASTDPGLTSTRTP